MKKISTIAILGLTAICANAIAAGETTGTQTTTATQNATTQQTTAGTQPVQTTTDAKSKGQAFLDSNKKQPGVVTLPDGLQYKVITVGKGQKPSLSDVVVVNYSGKLIDGTEFDSSYKRGEPATFPVGAVIPGWVEALQLMPVGSKWEVYIPSNLAYGEQGAPPAIGPNETLVFTIELLDAKKTS